MAQSNKPDTERLVRLYRTMNRIRAFEEAAVRAAHAGLVTGAVHPSIGQEAIAAGVSVHLERTDLITSTHRGHGHTLAKGADARAMMRELFGRAGGVCGGKGGSMHIADFDVGMLGANGVVADGMPIAVGAAHGMRLKGDGGIVVCYFGEGAINRGPFLEALNWAKVFDLPVLFVCEDNGFAATTRTASMTGGADAAGRAAALGVRARTIDGNDVLAVDDVAGEMIAEMRKGAGPLFLQAKTYRLSGHTAADKGLYRSDDEVRAAAAREPIARARATLVALGIEERRLAEIEAAAVAEMTAAHDEAAAAPFPDPEEAYRDVQDIGAPTWPS